MGCDIHLLAERKTDAGWQVIPGPIVACWACDEAVRPDCYYCNGTGKYRDEWYSDRCYAVFAALAGVRNGYGFAGIPTHRPLAPIADGRGMPADVSDEAREWLNNHGDHSQTWASLPEVLAYDWHQSIERPPNEPWVLAESAKWFLQRMEQLRELTAGEDVRLVFNFDS